MFNYFWNPSNPPTPHYPLLFSEMEPYKVIFLFLEGKKKLAEFLMIMYVNLVTATFPSQFYKIGNEFYVVLNKWKADLASTFCIYIH